MIASVEKPVSSLIFHLSSHAVSPIVLTELDYTPIAEDY